ncbi:MAG TPA: alpha/beta hydrolase [Eubacteriales bacterium]|nr:alpha/beta hydrolase [Eubacteriales bacterium]
MEKRGIEIVEEYVPVNGVDTYFLHFPEETGKPVLLMLHGGPGESMATMSCYFKRHFGKMCTLVTYDQRGAGRTFLKNPGAKPELSLLLSDLHAVIALLKERYGVSRVALLGQSWGSGLGSVYALEHPEDLLCYIGVGQLVNGTKNEAEGARVLKEKILAAGNQKDLAQFEAIGAYPVGENAPFDWGKIMQMRRLQRKYGLAVRFNAAFFKAFFSSPTLRFSDLTSMKKIFAFNAAMIEWVITQFTLETYPREYAVPVFYLLGERDYQTPVTLATAYFDSIEAPYKRLTLLKNAGHFPELDNMADFTAALQSALDTAVSL